MINWQDKYKKSLYHRAKSNFCDLHRLEREMKSIERFADGNYRPFNYVSSESWEKWLDRKKEMYEHSKRIIFNDFKYYKYNYFDPVKDLEATIKSIKKEIDSFDTNPEVKSLIFDNDDRDFYEYGLLPFYSDILSKLEKEDKDEKE